MTTKVIPVTEEVFDAIQTIAPLILAADHLDGFAQHLDSMPESVQVAFTVLAESLNEYIGSLPQFKLEISK